MKSFLPWLVLLILTASGCKEDAVIREWAKKVDVLRVKSLEAMPQSPYQAEQHHAFRDYFLEIEQMTIQLVQSEEYTAAFNRGIAKIDLKDVCARVFLEREDWQFIFDHCTKNGLFICAEEVRVYVDLVTEIRKRLVPKQQQRFDQTPECRAAF